ncbi:type II toxin-antitoxin system RelE/ParE family toxin [Nostoc sp. CENA67]|uniref:Type II toxin-antitoxin system RelE/ParE family toxin n=1 Tax=Amazonocrinis nigriterrae CENA67 TaxID=2794033 RepID=A0A8J7LAP1_9NOST|nr:type II toxin-antitoxin system RelE/ParE family toxin [Amazonocrinis nigriterrae]MBH8566869.1 type II toxin-antitoxin system RelE/ParE family toxin [Amazonocrinis nigriterrae CENA67]
MKIVWTQLALADLDAAYNYIAASNPNAAIDIIDHIEKALDQLIKYPEIGQFCRFPGTRELIITRTPFIIPYRVQADQIEILAIIHGARRWSDKL